MQRNPLGSAGALLLVLMLMAAVFAEALATHSPIRTDSAVTLSPPTRQHWLGTDHLGRDLYSRVIHGARVSLVVGLVSTLTGSLVGGIVGLLSGYWGGRIDLVIQRLTEMMQGLPLFVLVLVMAATLGPSVGTVIVAISFAFLPRAVRVVRASVLAIREFAYIEAARAIGAGHRRIALRHILPNALGLFIVLTTAQIGSAIIVESSLSYLGLGIPEPYPSWGRMLSVSAAEFAEKAPWLVIWPGLALSLSVFGANLLGDALRDTLDPRLRGLR